MRARQKPDAHCDNGWMVVAKCFPLAMVHSWRDGLEAGLDMEQTFLIIGYSDRK